MVTINYFISVLAVFIVAIYILELYLRIKKMDKKLKELSNNSLTESRLVNKLLVRTEKLSKQIIKDGSSVECPFCKGEGSIRMTPTLSKICHACDGSGIILIKKIGGC